MVSNPESATLSNARNDKATAEKRSASIDGLTIICSSYSFYEPSLSPAMIGGEFLLFSYQNTFYLQCL